MNATLPVPSRGDAAARMPTADLVGITWTRIQVTVRLRPTGGATLDPSAICLELERRGGAVMAPTHSEVGADVALRFNVMQGPGQRPLEEGRWRLVLAQPHGGPREPLVLGTAGPLDPARLGARFPLGSTVYAVAPEVDPATGVLALTVSLRPDPRGSRGGEAPDEGEPGDVGRAQRGQRRAIRRWVRRSGQLAFRISLRVARLVASRNGRRILFTSDSRAELGGNLKLVHDRMVERGLDREYELSTLLRPSIAMRRSFRDRVRLPWLLARADTIVIDDFQPVIYALDAGESRIVQLWHAVGAFKTVGYSRVGKPGGLNPYGRAHKNYALVTVSARTDIPVYAEAFGIPEDRVVATGIPRTDRFFDPAHGDRARDLALGAFPEARGRMTILLAPTFRGHGARTATYDLDRIDMAALHALCVERDAVCIVRMHPFVREPLHIPEGFRDRVLDGQRSPIDVNDLLFAVDLLVTDYSSIIYEFSILGRPMLFYAWDLDEYVADRDTYEPYETFVPGRIVRTFPELLEAIRREDYQLEKVAAFAERHFEHRDGRSTDRVVDLVLAR